MNAMFHQSDALASDAYRLLSAALDTSGFICIRGVAKGKPAIQTFFAPGDFQGAVNEAMRLSRIEYNAYFATSTFFTKDSAKAENVNAVKVFKIDLDIDKDDPKKYPTKKEAAQAVIDFCTKYMFPTPVMVDSGGGVHVYWIMTEALDADSGKLMSEKLKALLLALGIKIDVTVTGDVARILRVPDTLNYKKVVAREVKLKTAVDMHDTDVLCDLIDATYNNTGEPEIEAAAPTLLAGMAVPEHLKGVAIDKPTQGLLQGKPKNFHVLLKRSVEGDRKKGCAQIAYASEHQASIEEPRWRSALSVAWFCDDGKEAVHWISRGHNEYNHDETVKKASLTTGPHTCREFMKNWPTECDECPHKGRITSPIQLGVDDRTLAVEGNGISNDDTEVITRLTGLSKMEYDRVRTKEAEAIGVRVSTLDELVSAARGEKAAAEDSPFTKIEPWLEPVNPTDLLLEIVHLVKRFIVCEQQTAIGAALWITLTWFADYVQVLPLANITAPEKRCGKSMLLFLMARLVCRPLAASNISPAALFRSIDRWAPTILIDEADTFIRGDNEELRGLLNCGHTRESAFSIRTVGEDFRPVRFNLWGPKALAGIGTLAPTLVDRSIVLELRRKLPHEKVERLRHADSSQFDVIIRKLARFAQDFGAQVRDARPTLPEALNDRAADNWEGMLAIADIAGGDWPELARRAALKLSGETGNAGSIETELLQDIQEIFAAQADTRIFSSRLVQLLSADEDKRWATYNRGAPIRARQIASKLKGYGIESQNIRIGAIQAKGYDVQQFSDAFKRYLPQATDNSITT